MKTKVLFVIHQLAAGGAQRSLVSLLNSLPLDNYDIDLLVCNPDGLFNRLIPKTVNILEMPKEEICKSENFLSKRFWKLATFKIVILKIFSIISWYLLKKGNLNRIQFYNELWKKHIPKNKKQYDVAISYIDGCNYYVIDHVDSPKKILWNHNDYNKLGYDSFYDSNYYKKAYKICTISEICREILISHFSDLKDRIEVVENITSPKLIMREALVLDEMKMMQDGFIEDKRIKIVSIGRLSEQKGFDMAVEAAEILKNQGLDFCWYILGEGNLRNKLESECCNRKVSDCVKFIGIRSNPYAYILKSDLFVMPSRYEGKSIALDEAKILCKPIVVTEYPSVYDAVEHEKTGWLVKIDAESIAMGIHRVCNDKALCLTLVNNLKQIDCSNESSVIQKIKEMIEK